MQRHANPMISKAGVVLRMWFSISMGLMICLSVHRGAHVCSPPVFKPPSPPTLPHHPPHTHIKVLMLMHSTAHMHENAGMD